MNILKISFQYRIQNAEISNIANQIHGFTIDYGKFILNVNIHFQIFFEHMQSTNVHYKNIRKPIYFISLKGCDDIFDTKTLTFAMTVSNFSR